MSATYRPSDCPTCGAAAATTVATRDDVRIELERLWAFHLRRLRPGVPVERLADRVVFSQDPPLRVARCTSCGLVYRDPRDTDRSVTERYRDSAPTAELLESLFATQRQAEAARARRLTRVAGRHGRGVEVGCYAGAFLAAATEAGWRFEGLDVNQDVLRHVRRQGLTARAGSADSLRPDDHWDAVAIWTCLDQLPDPRGAVEAAAASLRPGGVLAVRVPNGAFYQYVRRRLDGPLAGSAERLLGWNNLLGFPYLQGFTPAALRRVLEGAGLRVVRTWGDVLVPLSDRWTRAWARAEERMVKAVLGWGSVAMSPWIEAYARRGPT